jgi:hypothetical protein
MLKNMTRRGNSKEDSSSIQWMIFTRHGFVKDFSSLSQLMRRGTNVAVELVALLNIFGKSQIQILSALL